jgi:hypothetical protein
VSPAEIQIPSHWNLIGRSTNAPPPALLPSNILLPLSSHSAFIPARKKFGALFKILILFSLKKLRLSEVS